MENLKIAILGTLGFSAGAVLMMIALQYYPIIIGTLVTLFWIGRVIYWNLTSDSRNY